MIWIASEIDVVVQDVMVQIVAIATFVVPL
jgi:hypothetical protein